MTPQRKLEVIAMGYKLCPQEMLDFLKDVWHSQGKVKNNCTGMAHVTHLRSRLTFVANDDCVIPAYLWNDFQNCSMR